MVRPPRDRRQLLLEGLDVGRTTGLEIGPLHNPILRKPDADVLYVDHVGTGALREKYAGDAAVRQELIVDIDIVWADGAFSDACGGRRFDYVVASHVIEHIPNVIGWLAQLKSVLHASGTVRLIVPDRRYCFDYRRQTSSVADMILAWRSNATVPGARPLLDFMLNIAPLELDEAWSAAPRPDPRPARKDFDGAIRVIEHVEAEGIYHDAHCWTFTPLGFARLMRQLAGYGLLGFACTRCTATEANSLDFFVHLTATDDERAIAESWDWAVRLHAPEQDGSDQVQQLQDELQSLRRSRSWRLTAPLRRLNRLSILKRIVSPGRRTR